MQEAEGTRRASHFVDEVSEVLAAEPTSKPPEQVDRTRAQVS